MGSNPVAPAKPFCLLFKWRNILLDNLNVNVYHNKVYEILNFLTKEECDDFMSIVNNSTEQD
jgi:hypothetical protein